MWQQWCCPNGHQWETLREAPSQNAAASLTCPVCGSVDATAVLAGTMARAAGSPVGAVAVDHTLTSPRVAPPPPRLPVAPASPSATEPNDTVARPATLPPPAPPPPARPDTQEPAPGAAAFNTLADDRKLRGTPPAADVSAVGGDYELLGTLGRGGMGVVYKARQKRLNRLVALKMILTGAHASDEDLVRFKIEAEAVAQLQHPNIVQIYEVGERDGRPFFSLEYIDGGSLAQKLDGTPLPVRKAAQLAATLARGIHYAHQKGIVHRDLKPHNVLLSADGTPKVTDFGLAKRLEGDSNQTGTDAVLGTPCYMAPEQASGKSHDVGPAADIYALGAMLYETLAGRPPFRGEGVLDTLEQVRTADPLPPSRLQPRVPRDLDTICLKCLEKEPKKRYASAAALAEDLERFLANRPILARPVSLMERTAKWARRRPAVAGLLATLAVVLAGGFIALFALWRHAEAESAEAVRQKTVADEATRVALQARDAVKTAYERERHSRYATHMGLAHTALRDGRPEHALDLLNQMALHQRGEADLRGFEWRYLRRLCSLDRLQLKGHTSLVTMLAFSPDGRRAVSASLDQTVRVWDLVTKTPLHALRGHRRAVRAVAFSPDSKLVATAAADGEVRLWDVESGKAVRTLTVNLDGEVAAVAFAPGGDLLATGGEDALVKLWDVKTGEMRRALKGHSYAVTAVAFSPKGDCLASASEDQTVRLWDPATETERGAPLRGHAYWVTCVAFGPEGKTVATGGWDQTVRLWDAVAAKPLRLVGRHDCPVLSVSFRPQGRFLASSGGDGTVKVWDLLEGGAKSFHGRPGLHRTVAFSEDGEFLTSVNFDPLIPDPTLRLHDPDRTVNAVVFCPDGSNRLVLAGGAVEPASHEVRGTVVVRRVVKEGEEATCEMALPPLAGHTAPVYAADYSPDGKLLATAGEDETVRIWDAATGKVLQVLKGHGRRVYAVKFRPQGEPLLASAAVDGTVRLWNPLTGAERGRLTGHRGAVRGLAFHPDGKTLASAGNDRTVRLWDVATGEVRHVLQGHEYAVLAVAFSPKDGQVLASASEDLTVRLWDTATGGKVATLKGHTDGVTAVAFSPDGKRVASASADQTVKLWDAATGEETLTLRGHTHRVTGLAFSPDGRWLATCGADQAVRLWEAPPPRPAGEELPLPSLRQAGQNTAAPKITAK